MTPQGLRECGITHFTQKSIEATGAKLADVKIETMVCLESLRRILNRKIMLIKNGITTGIHQSSQHPNGEAIDFYLDPSEGQIIPEEIFKCAENAAFHGIGLYWNPKLQGYSFHVDIRNARSYWRAIKDSDGVWHYSPVDFDPRNLKVS